MGFGIRYATSSPYWQYYYFGKNIQGDVIALYRSDYNSGSQSYYPTLVATYSYDPWGTPTGIYDANGNAISQTAYHVAAYNPFRYRGYRYDGDTRLYYLQNRYYDPAIGRFINADSPNFALTNPYSDGITDKNYFAYCDNNPINRNDDGGEFWNIVVGAVIGGIGGAISAAASGGNIALGAAQGAASGAVSALLPNKVVVKTVVSAGMALIGSVSQQLSNSGKINVASTIADTFWGAASGALGAKVGGFLDKDIGKSYSVLHAAGDLMIGTGATTFNVSSQAIISGFQRNKTERNRRNSSTSTSKKKNAVVSHRYRYARQVGCRVC